MMKDIIVKIKKNINVLVTTNADIVTKAQRIFNRNTNNWYWGRLYGKMKAWTPLLEPYEG